MDRRLSFISIRIILKVADCFISIKYKGIKMDRKEAIRIIVANECLTREDRELLIYNAWGLDGSDEIFYLLPEDLMS